jgi:hypothetical protein
MSSHDSSGTAYQTDALACWSAVALLRAVQQGDLADEQLALHLEELLSAMSLELEADLESVPKAVRFAAVELAMHIVRRSSIPVPGWGADEPVQHTDHGSDDATGRPFSRSMQLGRMG